MPAVNLNLHPLTSWTGPLGLPDFSQVRADDFTSVFDAAFLAHNAEIEAIAGNPEEPTIANTLAALELAGDALSRVSAVFWCLAGADTKPQLQALERELYEEGNFRLTAKPELKSVHFNRHASKRDHVLLYLVTGFSQEGAKLADYEIAEAGFYPVDKLPEDTTVGTRRRIAEILDGAEASPFW